MRRDGRKPEDLRPISFERSFLKYAEGSVLVKFGDTHVICTASVEESVPQFLRGSGQGWVTAEYAMLPRATDTRSEREVVGKKPNGRSMEIQRLIGRSLRCLMDMSLLEERTARFRCIVVLYDSKTGKTIMAEGTCEGIITTSPKGTNGFGFDPLFYILQLGRTMAELTFEEKMQISHRANALKELKSKLRYL